MIVVTPKYVFMSFRFSWIIWPRPRESSQAVRVARREYVSPMTIFSQEQYQFSRSRETRITLACVTDYKNSLKSLLFGIEGTHAFKYALTSSSANAMEEKLETSANFPSNWSKSSLLRAAVLSLLKNFASIAFSQRGLDSGCLIMCGLLRVAAQFLESKC